VLAPHQPGRIRVPRDYEPHETHRHLIGRLRPKRHVDPRVRIAVVDGCISPAYVMTYGTGVFSILQINAMVRKRNPQAWSKILNRFRTAVPVKTIS
jgi:hypothetical protein